MVYVIQPVSSGLFPVHLGDVGLNQLVRFFVELRRDGVAEKYVVDDLLGARNVVVSRIHARRWADAIDEAHANSEYRKLAFRSTYRSDT